MKKSILALGIAVVIATTVPVSAQAATSDIGRQIPGGGAAEQVGGWTFAFCQWMQWATCTGGGYGGGGAW